MMMGCGGSLLTADNVIETIDRAAQGLKGLRLQ
jgi:hypothetical protein